MSLSTTVNYDSASNFSFDNTKITVASDARCKLQTAAGDHIEDFADDTDHVYDNTKAEFVGGKIQSKSAANVTFYANYTSTIDATFSKATSLVGTGVGSPTIVSGNLDLTGGDKEVTYNAVNAADSVQTGTIRILVTPNYSGNPPANYNLWSRSQNKSQNNYLSLQHASTGSLILYGTTSLGATLINITISSWSPVAGTEYEVELNYDFTSGATRLFIDGVQLGSTSTATATFGTDVQSFTVGAAAWSPTVNYANIKVGEIVVWDTVQHTTNYTPSSFLLYQESSDITPEMVHAGLGTAIQFNSFTTVETGSPRYTIQVGRSGVYVYWNGVAWASSDGTYAQATDAATFNTNVGLINIGGEIYGQFKVHLPSGAAQTSVDNLIANVTGETAYPTDNPTIVPTSSFKTDGLLSFSANTTVTGSDLVKFCISVAGTPTYWDGTAWVTSDGTYLQSNTEAEINTNMPTLDLGTGKSIMINAHLHSDDGSTTPILTSVTSTYDFAAPTITEPAECIVFGYVRTLLGDPHASAVELRVTNENTFYYNSTSIVVPNIQSKFADTLGNVELSLIETVTPGKKYKFEIIYTDINDTQQTVLLGNAIVPNQDTVNIATLTFS